MESSFRSPVATGRFVWSANPTSGRVALVDAESLEVRVQEAGFGPTYLAAIPGSTNRAIVLNVLSYDANVLWVDSKNRIQTTRFDVHVGANAWVVGPRGGFAIAWTDATKLANPDATEGFQDVTVVKLEQAADGATQASATRLSVGYRPTRIFVNDDETRAYAVSEPGITVIDLSGASVQVLRDVAVTDDPLEDPASRDVTVTSDGAYALVRREGNADVGIVSLETGERVSVTLSGPVTDLDLAEDGSRAVAVVRDPASDDPVDAGTDAALDGGDASAADATGVGDALTDSTEGDADDATDAPPVDPGPPPPANSEAFVLPIPGIFANPTDFDRVTFTGETAGSVAIAPEGGVALFYTNAFANDHLTLLTIEPGADYLDFRTVAVKAPVRAVFPTPDGGHAVALLDPGPSSVKAGAFSIVPVASNLPPKIQGTEAAPMAVAISRDPSDRAIITVRDDAQRIHGVYLVRMPELRVDHFDLSSPPLATGMVTEARSGFVAQEHPEGRITFIELDDGKARTLTGFELGAKVVDGSEP